MAQESVNQNGQQGAGEQQPAIGAEEKAWTDGMEAKYPDLKGDREALFRASREGYDKDHEELKSKRTAMDQFKAEADELDGILKSDQNLNDFFLDMYSLHREGKKPSLALAHLKPITQSYINGEINDEEYQAEVERIAAENAKVSKSQELHDTAFTKLCKEQGLDPQEMYKKLSAIIGSPSETEEQADKVARAYLNMLTFDDAVAAARVAGRNEKIVEEKRQHAKGDGMPSGGGSPASTPRKGKSANEMAADNAVTMRKLFG